MDDANRAGEPRMDAETCLFRLHQLALANVATLAKRADRERLQQQINRDHGRIESVLSGVVIFGDATDAAGGDFSDCAQPPRLDLAMGALAVAMGTTTDPEIRPWLQTAIDFLTGDYGPLETGDE
jgi:hypothetical protein